MKPLPNPDNDRAKFLRDLEAAENGDAHALLTIRHLLQSIAQEGSNGDIVCLGHTIAELWHRDDEEQAECN